MVLTSGFLVFVLTLSTAPIERPLDPVTHAPVDCTGDGTQPCTGTECVNQQRVFFCNEGGETPREITCQWDLQYYTGGNTVCCTGRNVCDRCVDPRRPYVLYQYNGVNKAGCVTQ